MMHFDDCHTTRVFHNNSIHIQSFVNSVKRQKKHLYGIFMKIHCSAHGIFLSIKILHDKEIKTLYIFFVIQTFNCGEIFDMINFCAKWHCMVIRITKTATSSDWYVEVVIVYWNKLMCMNTVKIPYSHL